MAHSGGSNQTALPSCNRLLERKWNEKRLQGHHERVSESCLKLLKGNKVKTIVLIMMINLQVTIYLPVHCLVY